jgi:hypothetical protein
VFIVIFGNVVDGYSFYGPFKTSDEALDYARSLDEGDCHWEIAKLKKD